jgi:glycosyltransferase involved in cell wall biosynthesis
MNILIAGHNSASEYSGGRYHAWMIAEALAHIGHRVSIWTNNRPVFQDDFLLYPRHQSITIFKSPKFDDPPTIKADIVILVPHSGKDDFYYKVILFSKRNRARLVLLNFETPNWYNSLSPQIKDASLWNGWVETARYADMILSIANEGDRFAREFYKKIQPGTLFRSCYPSINSLVADRTEPGQSNKQIIAITRFIENQRHKGGVDLIDALCPAMEGYTLSILVGTGNIDSSLKDALKNKAESLGINVRFLYRLNDWEKFREIKRSSLMLFLSYFEGFGLPPIESQYCDVPCIVYDLPVLREVSGEGLIYVKCGDRNELKTAIVNVLLKKYLPPFSLKKNIASVGQFEFYTKRLSNILEEITTMPNHSYGIDIISKLKEIEWKCRLLKSKYMGVLKLMISPANRIGKKIIRLLQGN